MTASDQAAQVLPRESVVLGCKTTTMEAAIEYVGGLLVDRGVVASGYIQGMKDREATVSTYLGNGVALPHGTFETRDEVKGTGIVVAQYPDGIPWGDGTAHLVIGLAATGEDHVQVLSQLAEILQDEELCEKLWTTEDADFLHETLNTIAEEEDDEDDEEESGPAEASAELVILNPAGLHARPAALVVERAKALESDITIGIKGKEVSAKSILGVLSLGGVTGDTAVVKAKGPDAQHAITQISEILTATEEEL